MRSVIAGIYGRFAARRGARFCWLLLLALPASADVLDEAVELARAGVPMLALTLFDQHQPGPDEPEAWMRWERERIALLQAADRHEAVVERVAEAPRTLPDEALAWLEQQRILAHLALGQGEQARQVIAQRLWQGEAPPGGDALAGLRRQLIDALLLAGDDAAALNASRRLRHDHGVEAVEDALLHAVVLLRNDEAAAAAALLAGHGSGLAPWLRDLARLRAGTWPPVEAVTQLTRRLRELRNEGEVTAFAAAVTAEAARLAHDPAAHAAALERLGAYPLGREARAWLTISGLDDGDALWESWLRLATEAGNRKQLLVGDDPPWFAAAEAAVAAGDERLARAIYALVAVRSPEPRSREQGHQRLMARLLQAEQGGRLMRWLYLEAPRRYPSIESIPPLVRYQLSDSAITAGDLQLATRLLADLLRPPPGVDGYLWHLQRARIFVLAGQPERGAEGLAQLLETYPRLDDESIDRMLQVVFDLQAVEAHDEAVGLLAALLARATDTQRQREILYWLADSRKAQGEHVEAGLLYLQSAIVPGVTTMDPWAQSARYQAAQQLAEAGLRDDARRLYRDLLRVTEDAARRAVLLRDLRQLGGTE